MISHVVRDRAKFSQLPAGATSVAEGSSKRVRKRTNVQGTRARARKISIVYAGNGRVEAVQEEEKGVEREREEKG